MVFPYIADQNFELGTAGEFTSETDTESKLSIAHYAQLARHGARIEVPYAGAYCAWIDLSLGTADAYVQEDTLYDLAADATLHIRFMFYAKGLVMAASDRFTILSLDSAGPVSEMTISILNNAGRMQFVAAETGATAVGSGRVVDLIQDEWHALELSVNIDAGGGNDGTANFYVDGYQIGAQITGLDQAAIVQARFGAMGIDAGTTAGHLLFDAIIADDTRVYPPARRWGAERLATKSGHLFVGPGQLQRVTLMAGAATDNALICYDTDEADITRPGRIIIPELRNAQGASDTVTYDVPHDAGYFQRGCYVALSGTNPRAHITARRATEGSGVAGLRDYAARRPIVGVW